MLTKLTLTVDGDVIEQAKSYAKTHHMSLSKMVEHYFKSLQGKKRSTPKLTGVVAELAGVLSDKDVANLEQDYTDYLVNKYTS